MSYKISRRAAVIGAIGGVAATAIGLKAEASNEIRGGITGMSNNKIDTHHHYLPKIYVDAVGLDTLAGMMPTKVAPTWSPDMAIAMMDTNGIGEGILSISSGPHIPNAPTLLRKCNDVAAEMRMKYPGRFGSFASLPLPDVDASLKEIAYSLDTLKVDGFIIFTNYDGKYLGDPHFLPVLEELNRRKAVAFIHPNSPTYSLEGLPPESVIEFPFDTTRTAVSLITSGAIKAFPNISFILSHAGGTLPYLSARIAGGIRLNPVVSERVGDPMEAFRAFYYDTALSVSKPSLAALMAVADPSRIIFGTDFPMAPPFAIQMTSDGLTHAPLEEGLRAGIFRGNAARLLSRA